MHNPDTVLPRLLCLARLSVRVGNDQEIQFLRHRCRNLEALVCREFLRHITSNEIPPYGASAFTGATDELSGPVLDRCYAFIRYGAALTGADQVLELILG